MPHDKTSGAGTSVVGLRLIYAGHPVDPTVDGVLRSQSRRGILVELASPFLANQHIMMAMPDGSSCRIEVAFPNNDPPPRTAEVLRLDKEKNEDSEQSCFVVELAYVQAPADTVRSKIWAPFRRKAGELIRGGGDFD